MSLPALITRLLGLETHAADKTNNPHAVTAKQVGAYTKAETDAKTDELKAAIANLAGGGSAGDSAAGFTSITSIISSGNWTPTRTGIHALVLVGGGGPGGNGGAALAGAGSVIWKGGGGGGGGAGEVVTFFANITAKTPLAVTVGASGGNTSITINGVTYTAGGGGSGGDGGNGFPSGTAPGGGGGGGFDGRGGVAGKAGEAGPPRVVGVAGEDSPFGATGGGAATGPEDTYVAGTGGTGAPAPYPTAQKYGAGGNGGVGASAVGAGAAGANGKQGCIFVIS